MTTRSDIEGTISTPRPYALCESPRRPSFFVALHALSASRASDLPLSKRSTSPALSQSSSATVEPISVGDSAWIGHQPGFNGLDIAARMGALGDPNEP